MELSIRNTPQGISQTNTRIQKRSFVYSLLIHGLLVIVIIYFSPKIEQPRPVIHQIINAKLYNLALKPPPTITPKAHKLPKESNGNFRIEKKYPDAKRNNAKASAEHPKKTNKNTQKEPINGPLNNIKKVQNNYSKVIDLSLDKLSKQVINKAMNQGAIESYKQYMEDKNSIPKSTTKLNQLSEPKAVEVKVNCDNALSKGLTVLSGIMGGTIKCNINKDFQKYIDARLEKMGKKVKKN